MVSAAHGCVLGDPALHVEACVVADLASCYWWLARGCCMASQQAGCVNVGRVNRQPLQRPGAESDRSGNLISGQGLCKRTGMAWKISFPPTGWRQSPGGRPRAVPSLRLHLCAALLSSVHLWWLPLFACNEGCLAACSIDGERCAWLCARGSCSAC
jgi:hypothetical protein